MKKLNRINMTETIDKDIKWELDGSLQDAIETLQTYYDRHKDTFDSLYIDISTERGYGDSYVVIALMGRRPETDTEYEKRTKVDLQLKETRAANEKKQYEQLKKKYEKLEKKYGDKK